MKEQLTLADLAPYLPYGLMIQYNDYFKEIALMKAIHYNKNKNRTQLSIKTLRVKYTQNCFIGSVKPILRPLSDLNKEEGEINTPESLQKCGYSYINTLLSEHYDVFGLIEKGLAIPYSEVYKDDENTMDEHDLNFDKRFKPES